MPKSKKKFHLAPISYSRKNLKPKANFSFLFKLFFYLSVYFGTETASRLFGFENKKIFLLPGVDATFNCNLGYSGVKASCYSDTTRFPRAVMPALPQTATVGVLYELPLFLEYKNPYQCVNIPTNPTTCAVITTTAQGPLNYILLKADGTPVPDWLTFVQGPNLLRGVPDSKSVPSLSITIQSFCGAGQAVTLSGTVYLCSTISQSLSFTISINPSLNVGNATQNNVYIQNSNLNLLPIVVSTPRLNYEVTLQLSNPSAGKIKEDYQGSILGVFKPEIATWLASGDSASVQAMLNRLVFIPTKNYYGNFSIKVTIDDGYNVPVIDNITMIGIHVNQAPTIVSNIGTINLLVGQLFASPSYNNTLADIDSVLTFSSTKEDGSALDSSWIIFSSGSVIYTMNPTKSQLGPNLIKLVGSDGQYSVSQTFTVNVNPSLVISNIPFALTFTEDQTLLWPPMLVNSLRTVTAEIQITPNNAGVLQSNNTAVPAWNFNPSTGVWTMTGNPAQLNTKFSGFSFVPSQYYDRSITVQVRFSDSGVNIDVQQQFIISCNAIPNPPMVNQVLPDQVAKLGVGLNLDLSSVFKTVNTGDTLSLSGNTDSGPLPFFVSLNNNRLIVNPTKNDLNRYHIQLSARSSLAGSSVSAWFWLDVQSSMNMDLKQSVQNLPSGNKVGLGTPLISTNQPRMTVSTTVLNATGVVLTTGTVGLATSTFDKNSLEWMASGPVGDVSSLLSSIYIQLSNSGNNQFSIKFSADDQVNPISEKIAKMIVSGPQEMSVGSTLNYIFDPSLIVGLDLSTLQVKGFNTLSGRVLQGINYIANNTLSWTPDKTQVMSDVIQVTLQDVNQQSALIRFPASVLPGVRIQYPQPVKFYTPGMNVSLPPLSVFGSLDPITINVGVDPIEAGTILLANHNSLSNINTTDTGFSFIGNRQDANLFLEDLVFRASPDAVSNARLVSVVQDAANDPVSQSLILFYIVSTYDASVGEMFQLSIPSALVKTGYQLSFNTSGFPWFNYDEAKGLLSGKPALADQRVWPIDLSVQQNGVILDQINFRIDVQNALQVKATQTSYTGSADTSFKLVGLSVATNQDSITAILKLSDPKSGKLTASILGRRRLVAQASATEIYNPAIGEWRATGPEEAVNDALKQVQFIPNNHFYGDVIITLKSDDGINPPTPAKEINIHLNKLDVAPTINDKIKINCPPQAACGQIFCGQKVTCSFPENAFSAYYLDDQANLSYDALEHNKNKLPGFCSIKGNNLVCYPTRSDIKTWFFDISAVSSSDKKSAASLVEWEFTGTTWLVVGIYSASAILSFLFALYGYLTQRHIPVNIYRTSIKKDQYIEESRTLDSENSTEEIYLKDVSYNDISSVVVTHEDLGRIYKFFVNREVLEKRYSGFFSYEKGGSQAESAGSDDQEKLIHTKIVLTHDLENPGKYSAKFFDKSRYLLKKVPFEVRNLQNNAPRIPQRIQGTTPISGGIEMKEVNSSMTTHL